MTEVLLAMEEGVATLTLAAPERRNALTPEMARQVVEACETIDADPSVVRSMRSELGPPAVPWATALEAETSVQLRSLKRLHDRAEAE